MISFLLNLVKNLSGVFLNILPLLVVVTAFQLFVIKQPFPDLAATISGLIFVLVQNLCKRIWGVGWCYCSLSGNCCLCVFVFVFVKIGRASCRERV